ncbi:class I tRNA ligase family protein [Patescibacteria group bacterium]|nr:class I tRNA ligase family protein [Patescibacteria group bacterium]
MEDFSISRETNKFGIPLPFDPDHVTYVWFDALLNYITVCQDGSDFWSADTEKYHVLGKDIVRFHAIYWPAMLMSAGFELPNHEVVT